MLKTKTNGWYGGNARWTTYECTGCNNEVHVTSRDPDPSFCPFCGQPAGPDNTAPQGYCCPFCGGDHVGAVCDEKTNEHRP